MDQQYITTLIASIAALLISVLTERIPLVRKWWREDLDAMYTPEEADTIRLSVQVGLTVLAAFIAYYAMALGYVPGGVPTDHVFIPAVISAIIAVFVNQGTFHLDKRYWRGERK